MKKYFKKKTNINFISICVLILFVGNTIFSFNLYELAREPIVGLTQDNQTTILVRGNSPGNIQIEFHEVLGDTQTKFTDWKRLSFATDLTTNFILPVKYNTNYNYRVTFEDGTKSKWYNFTTFPEQSESGNFSFIFSADFRENFLPHSIFDYISTMEPTFVALLGDQIIADYGGDVNNSPSYSILPAFRSKYLRNFDEHFQALGSQIPIVATWDDHDYGRDNSDNTYPNKEIAKQVFKENYPAYPYEVENGGIHYKFTIADVDVFVLDTRWYRSPMQENDVQGKTMLGEEQLSWFLNNLKQSSAPFKIVFSGVSLNDYGGDVSSDRDGFDSWMGYKYERNRIISFVEENQIKGVMFFSGDQHFPSAHILNWKKPLNFVSQTDTSIEYSLSDLGAAVFDFSASPLNIKRAAGHKLISEHQNDPAYSYEIYRTPWANPGAYSNDVITSIYGLVVVETKDSIQSVSVKFCELDKNNSKIKILYKVSVSNDRTTYLEDEPIKIPTSILVAHNYPNPFNGETNILYSLPTKSEVEISIYDIRGSKVITLLKKMQDVGEYKTVWNGKNSFGELLPSGIYFYRLTTIGNSPKSDFQSVVKKIVYLK